MKAKKSLGQNFLHSKKILSEIIRAADVRSEDIVLEVGPGKGTLTEMLLQSVRQVIAVEKDDRLIPLLDEKFSEEIKNKKLKIIHQDILEFNPEDYGLIADNFKIVANIPYYITGVLLRKFLEGDRQPTRMVLMIQKEVAKRIVAADRKESLLSISVKAYGRPRYIKTVPARFFAPVPKVDSAILLVENISKKFFLENKISEEKFFEIVKAGFAHKRKYVISNLRQRERPGEISWKEKFRRGQISEKARAESLKLDDWGCLLS